MTQNTDIEISEVEVTDHPEYMDHETVYKIHSAGRNVTAFISIHNSALGPALGGIRFKHYQSQDEALGDVLRLAEAMTWKNAAGGLAHGGGKGVLMASEGETAPSKEALDVLIYGLNRINENAALYYGAEDMNFNEESLDYIFAQAPWIKGATSDDPSVVSGTPAPLTAIGVYECMKVAAKYKLGKDSLRDLRVSMQGLGAVGKELAKHLSKDGVTLIGCDVSDAPFEQLAAEGVSIERVGLDEIYDAPADIFAPNAIGGTINEETIQRLKTAGVQIVCGAANNQQRDQVGSSESKTMHEQGILYCPDYIVNAGGVIWVAKVGEDAQAVTEDIREGVPKRFEEVLKLHEQEPESDLATIAARYSRKRVEEARAQKDRKAG